MRRTTLLLGLILVGAALVLAACGGQTTTPTAEGPAATEAPTAVPLAVPFEEGFLASGHADATAEAFVHWDAEDPAVVPGACARCHSSAGYIDFLTNGEAADVRRPGRCVRLRDVPQRPGHGPDLGHLPLRQGRGDLRGGRGASA